MFVLSIPIKHETSAFLTMFRRSKQHNLFPISIRFQSHEADARRLIRILYGNVIFIKM